MGKQSQSKAEKTTDLAPLEIKDRGLELRTINDLERFAAGAKASNWLPKHITNTAQAMMTIEMGMEVGLPPWSALKHIAVINGVPSIWGDAAIGLCQASPHWEEAGHQEWFEGDSTATLKACCQVQRKGGEPYTAVFSWVDAERAKLTGKDTYKQYPKDMLMWRARSRALKAKFSDVLMGLSVEAPAEFVESVVRPVDRPAAQWPPEVERRDATDAVDRALAELPADEEQPEAVEA